MSGRKFEAAAGGRWAPLSVLRPWNLLASALIGGMDWDHHSVKAELKELFGAENTTALDRYAEKARRDLWQDTYRAHLEFVKAVNECYG